VAYSLRKWLRLALSGNPTVLLLLFSPPESLLICTERGASLRSLAPAIVSRKAGPRFVGYMRTQKERLIGARGQRRVNRPELLEAHGFDTKYAMHVARLRLQGIELLSTGRLTLESDRSRVMAIRKGDVPLEEALTEIDKIEHQLHEAVEASPLRAEPDYERVDAFLVDSYRESWGWK
jgi:predicted nucleotidyltransferase